MRPGRPPLPVPVNINVTAAATQSNPSPISMTSGNAATATFTLGTGSITIDAPTGGTQYNGTTLQIQQSRINRGRGDRGWPLTTLPKTR